MMSRPFPVASLMTAMLAVGCAHTLRGTRMHIDVSATPPAVVAGFHRDFPGLNISHTDLFRAADGTETYELKFRDAMNKYRHKIYSADGQLQGDKTDVILPDASHPAPTATP